MLSPVRCVLTSNILIHLKDRAKTAPLHSALPANSRHWLGADSKAAHVGVCTGRSQVTCHRSYAPQATSAAHSVHAHDLDLLLLQQCLWLFWRRIMLSLLCPSLPYGQWTNSGPHVSTGVISSSSFAFCLFLFSQPAASNICKACLKKPSCTLVQGRRRRVHAT